MFLDPLKAELIHWREMTQIFLGSYEFLLLMRREEFAPLHKKCNLNVKLLITKQARNGSKYVNCWLFFPGLYLLYHIDACVTLATLSEESHRNSYQHETRMIKFQAKTWKHKAKTWCFTLHVLPGHRQVNNNFYWTFWSAESILQSP